ncbi:MAG: hypothetical protein HYY87_00625 [Candidatus Levybacteria bacterium]|nr:hypothetical protein [Candidatus Levybacteria bacterium]
MIVVARFLSFLFHPINLFIPVPFFVVYKQTQNLLYALKWEFFSSAFIFIGILIFVFGRMKGWFSDQDLSKREERYLFYKILFGLVLAYLISAVFFKGIVFPLSILSFGIVSGILVFEIVNHRIKASIHVGVASAFVIGMSLLYGSAGFLTTVWVLPLVMWSRLKLKKHTFYETVLGSFLGITVTVATFFIGKYIHS